MSDAADRTARTELATISARLGADPMLVQAAGGNTSIKLDDTLWIKASGQWLADAATRDIMVPVSISAICHAFATGANVENASQFQREPTKLRPSIETAMHALLPDRVVLHVHCINTIAIAVRADAPDLLAKRLHGLVWTFIPYVRPGQPLATAIAARPGFDVYILGNHGLTVCADTIKAATALLDDVASRLATAPRSAPPADTATLARHAAGTDYEAAPDPIHSIATDATSFVHASAGSLYPDHVIFLGPGIATTIDTNAPLVLIEGAGALIQRDASAAARAMAGALADVTARIPSSAPLVTLTGADEAALLGMESETYRQSLIR